MRAGMRSRTPETRATPHTCSLERSRSLEPERSHEMRKQARFQEREVFTLLDNYAALLPHCRNNGATSFESNSVGSLGRMSCLCTMLSSHAAVWGEWMSFCMSTSKRLCFFVTAATLRAMTAADLVHEVNSIACCRLCGWRMLLVLHSMRNTCTLEFEPFIARRA